MKETITVGNLIQALRVYDKDLEVRVRKPLDGQTLGIKSCYCSNGITPFIELQIKKEDDNLTTMKTYKTLKSLATDIGISEATVKRWKKKGKVIKGTRKVEVEVEEKCYYLNN